MSLRKDVFCEGWMRLPLTVRKTGGSLIFRLEKTKRTVLGV